MAVIRVANVAYLTGLDGVFDDEEAHVLVVSGSDAVLFTDSRYIESMTEQARAIGLDLRCGTGGLPSDVCALVGAWGAQELVLEDSISYAKVEEYKKRSSVPVAIVGGRVEALRREKSATEIARISEAQRLTDAAFTHILEIVRPGITEREVALELEFFMRKHGSDGVAFAPIVASGPNSALPHAKVTDRAVQPGEFFKLDFGARVDGYCADMTRTIVVGSADDEMRTLYETVLKANRSGIDAVRSGVEGKAVDAVARAVIEGAGYGQFFGHGLGHGVGREVHEAPNMGPRSSDVLSPGCVVTVEPGIYLPGRGGVRIEDLVVVGEGGNSVLTTSPKELIEL